LAGSGFLVPCLLQGVLLFQTKHHRSMSFLVSVALNLASRLHLNFPSMYRFGVLPAFMSVLCYFTCWNDTDQSSTCHKTWSRKISMMTRDAMCKTH
jgi:hypothetical protein